MILERLIQEKLDRLARSRVRSDGGPATATAATPATPNTRVGAGVAGVAGVAVAAGRTETAGAAHGRLPAGAAGDEPPRPQDAEALREAYEERAAIFEYEAGLPREEAERQAHALVYGHRRGTATPDGKGGWHVEVWPGPPGPAPTEPLSRADEDRIRQWAAAIGETDAAAIGELLDECRRDATARANVLAMALAVRGLP